MDCSPPGSSVHGILQATILKWVAIPSPGDLPNPGIKPRSPALQADFLLSELPGKPHSVAKYSEFIVFLVNIPECQGSENLSFSSGKTVVHNDYLLR